MNNSKTSNLTSNRLEYVEKNPFPVDQMPVQHLLNKLAKSSSLMVMRQEVDKEKKCFRYQVMINANKSEYREISFEEACKIMHWKSFKFVPYGTGLCDVIKYKIDYDWFKPIEDDKIIKHKNTDKKEDDGPKIKTEWRTKNLPIRNTILDGLA